MARQLLVLALISIALVGLVSAAAADAPKSSPGGSAMAATPGNDDDAIGNTDDEAAAAPSNGDDGGAVEGPMGSEEEAKAHAGAAMAPASGSTTIGVSIVAATSAVAGYLVF